MRARSVIVFFVAITLSLLAAVHRFRDSGHAVGLLSAQGGRVRHAIHLAPGKQQYLLIVTGTVLPPYRGNAHVDVEGWPEMDCEIHYSRPVIDFGLRRKPNFRDRVLENLEPRDRFALWFILKPRCADWNTAVQTRPPRNTVVFRDAKTGRPLLQVPVVFQPEERRRGGED